MSLLTECGIPTNQKELYNHVNFNYRQSLGKCVKGYKYDNILDYKFCKWMHYENNDTDKYIFAYGNMKEALENDTYIFTVTIKKYKQFEAYAARIDILNGDIIYNFTNDTYNLQGEWKHEKITDSYMINSKLYEKTIHRKVYNDYEKIKEVVKFID